MSRPKINKIPYYREHEVPTHTYDNNRLPDFECMDALMSMMDPTHKTMRSLENHLDTIFEKHHGGSLDEEDYY